MIDSQSLDEILPIDHAIGSTDDFAAQVFNVRKDSDIIAMAHVKHRVET